MFRRRTKRSTVRRRKKRGIDRELDLQIVPLEPRFVLNASAELSPLGQLLVSGSSDADFVELQIEPNGDLSLRDEVGDPIPIANHPDGPGNETNPLDRADVIEIQFSMDGGNDTLELELPRGIDVSVLPSEGDDQTDLDFNEFTSAQTAPESLIDVQSELIRIATATGNVAFADAAVQLDGQVLFGSTLFSSQIDVTRASLDLDGSFLLDGDVTFTGSGFVDLSGASVTASREGLALEVDLGSSSSSRFLLGGADDSAGALLDELSVRSAGEVVLGSSTISIDGTLTVGQVSGEALFSAPIEAASVDVQDVGSIEVRDSMIARDGGVVLSTSGALDIAGDIDTTSSAANGDIDLRGATVRLEDSMLKTDGGLVSVEGPATIQGSILIETGDDQSLIDAGDVQFANMITGFDGQGDELRVTATSGGTDGLVMFDETIELNQLEVDGDQIDLKSASITLGDIVLRGSEIRLAGDLLQTSIAGDIIVDGTLLLPTGNTSIVAADRVQFTSSIRGQVGTQELSVTAGSEALFEGQVQELGQLVVDGGQRAQFDDSVALAGNLEVSAEIIQIGSDVTTTAGALAGQVQLQGESQIQIANGATVDVGDASILINGGGGEINTTDSTLRTTATDSAVTFQNASRLTLGSIEAGVGQVVMGINQDLTGPTTQAIGSTVTIDRLLVSSTESINLSNNGNELRVIEQVEALGDVTIRDDIDELAVVLIAASTADVTLFAAGLLSLSQSAVTTDGIVRVEAGGQIIDADDNVQSNIEAGLVRLQAASIGTIDNALDVAAAQLLDADTSSVGGDMFIANSQGDLRIGQLASGSGDIDLQALVVQLDEAVITTVGGSVQIEGPTTIQGSVQIQTGDTQSAIDAGDVRFTDTITGFDGIGDSLKVDARSGNLGGIVEFLGVIDLNGLTAEGRQVDLPSVSVTQGDIVLRAGEIRLNGDDLQTTLAGDIIVDGTLLLPTGDASITAADRAQFTSPIVGQNGTGHLSVSATDEALFEGRLEGATRLDVDGGQSARFLDSVLLAGDFDVTAENIQIDADVTTTVGSNDGEVRLQGETQVQIGNNATINSGNASIRIDGGGGTIDSSNATLTTSAFDSAIVFQNTSQLTLGNIVATAGQVVMGVNQDLTGPTTQAIASTLSVDRLVVSTTDSLELSNAGNDIRVIEQIDTLGEVLIRDQVNDLSVISIDASTTNVSLFSTGTISLGQQAISTNATVRLEAGGSIVDGDDNGELNVEAGVIDLQAASVGSVSNALDVSATQILNADTSVAGGDVFLANLQGDLRIGQVNAGSAGTVGLEASGAIVDANDDAQVNTVAGIINLQAASIGSVDNAFDVSASQELNADTSVAGGDVFLANLQGDLRIGLITAGASATVDLEAIGSIVDANADTQLNVLAGVINLQAASIGSVDNALDVTADQHLSADTSAADGDIFLANLQGDLRIGLINAGASATVDLEAIGSIVDANAGDQLNISAGVISLQAASIGSVDNAFDVSASQELNADTSIAGGDVFLANLQGDLRVGLINAATSATVDLEATGSIVDANADAQLNVVAGVINLQAASIGSIGNALDVSAAQGLNADTSAADGDVFLANLQGDLRIGLINAGASATVDLESIGAIVDANADAQLNVLAGVINLQAASIGSVDDALDVTADQHLSADASAADGDIFLANLQGDLRISQLNAGLNGTVGLAASGQIVDAKADDQLNVSAGVINLQASGIGSVDNALDVSASQRVNADTSNAGGDVFLANLQGDLRVGLITAGTSATVDLETIGSIVDANADAQLNVLAGVINLHAASIGSVDNSFDVSAAQELDADTSVSGGDIFLANLQGDLRIGLITAASSATVDLEATGSIVDAKADAQLNVLAGVINLQAASIGSVDNAFDVSASQELNADASAAGGDVFLANLQGDLRVGLITAAASATVDLEAIGSIVDANADAQVNVLAGVINLHAASIGSVDNAFDVSANQELNADSSAAGGDVFLANLQGDLRVGLINAGASATVDLEAFGSIVDANADVQLNVLAGGINLQAASIGSIGNALDVSASQELNADTSAAGGDIFLANLQGDLRVGLITAATSATVDLEAIGSIVDANADAQLNISAGVINLQAASIGSIGNALDVSATQHLSADTSAADGDIFIANLQGDLRISQLNAGANGTVDLAVSGPVTDAKDDDQLNVLAGVVNLQAASIGSVDNALDVSASQELNADTSASGGDIFLANLQGDLRVGLITAAASATVDLEAIGSIIDANADAQLNVLAGVINLQAASIGSVDNAFDVSASQEVNSDASAAGGDVFLANLQDDLRIGLINAGASATVGLEAIGSIVDANADAQLNIAAGVISLQAASIGSVDNALDVSASQRVNADTSIAVGDVFLANLQGDLRVGLINAETSATVDLETSGAIVDANADAQLNVLAGVINLQAASIGSVDNAFDVSASQELHADTSAAGGDIFLANLQGDLRVGLITAGTSATVDLETSGAIVDANADDQLNVLAGVINLQAASIGSVDNAFDVSAGQELNADTSAAGGDIFLANLQGDLRVGLINAATSATVDLETIGSIVDTNADDQVNVLAGVINLQAASIGSIGNALDVSAAQALNADTSTAGGDMFLANQQGDLRVGQLRAGNVATITLDSSGQIVDANADDQINIEAGVINLLAAGVGSIDNPLDVFAVEKVNVDTSTVGGDIFLANLQDVLRVGDLDAGVGSISLQAVTVQLHQSVLTTQGGSVRVDGPTTIQGSVLIQTGDPVSTVDAGDVQFTDIIRGFDGQSDTLQVDARSGGVDGLVELLGPIDLNGLMVDGRQIVLESVSVAQGDVVLQASEIQLIGETIQTLVTGDIFVEGILVLPAGDSAIAAAGRVQLTSPVRGQFGTGDLSVTAGSEALLEGPVENIDRLTVVGGQLAQFDGSVSLSGDFDVTAENIQINANVSTTAGSTAGQVRLQGETLIQIRNEAVVDSGDASIRINGGGGEIDTTESTLQTTETDLAILFENTSRLTLGTLEASVGQVVMGVSRDLTGEITQSIGSTVSIDRLVVSSTEQINLSNSGNDVRVIQRIETFGEVTIRDEVDDLAVIAIDASAANITLFASGMISLSQSAITTDGTVRLEAGGQIIDGDNSEELNIEAGIVNLQAAGIGSVGNPLDIFAIQQLNADTSATGGDVVIANTQGDLPLGQLNAGVGNIDLLAGDDVLQSDGQSLVVADDLSIVARNAEADGLEAIRLNTNVSDFQASVLGANRGDIRLVEQDSLHLASSNELGDEIVETSNGQIIVVATESITVSDHSVGDDGLDRKQDPELVARGLNGRIDLEVLSPTGFIELDETAQLVAEQKTPDAVFDEAVSQTTPPAIELERDDRAVFIQADSVRFGSQIEIFTGVDQGTARVFAPRPLGLEPPGENEPFPDTDEVGDGGSAFFVASSVRTTLLEQALVNDATGTLSLDIGQTGEKGLTIDIDWGAPTEPGEPGEPERFQRIDGVDADRRTDVDQDGNVVELDVSPQARLSVEHLYSEANILDSEANGRPSSTDPFIVLFSVRHHASILVLAADVQQGDAVELDTPGVISSTDDPLTEAFENGRANFLIPNLTIPVDFVPVRDVIPEIETMEVVVRSETSIEFVQPNLETTEFSITPIVVRDEYFQIRALNADPTGEDLAVQRLPDDILSGDKIRNLLSRLPDGSYEIEYVLGDTTRRTIFRVEIRDGQATIPSETLDEGVLRLQEIYGDESSDSQDDANVGRESDADPELETDEALGVENQSDAEPLPVPTGDDGVETENLPSEAIPDIDDQTLLPKQGDLLPLIGISTLTATGYRRGKRSRFSRASAFSKRWGSPENHA